jgi:hypothetical protein
MTVSLIVQKFLRTLIDSTRDNDVSTQKSNFHLSSSSPIQKMHLWYRKVIKNDLFRGVAGKNLHSIEIEKYHSVENDIVFSNEEGHPTTEFQSPSYQHKIYTTTEYQTNSYQHKLSTVTRGPPTHNSKKLTTLTTIQRQLECSYGSNVRNTSNSNGKCRLHRPSGRWNFGMMTTKKVYMLTIRN